MTAKEPTKREEAESNEDKAKQAQKQGDDSRSDAVKRTEQQQAGIPDAAIVDPGTPSINEPPGSDVIPPETKAAVEQANKDLEAQAQNAAKQTAAQQQPGSEQEIADKRRAGQQVPPPTGKPGDDDDDEDKKGKRK